MFIPRNDQVPCSYLFDLPTTDYSLDFSQHWVLVPVPFCARLAESLFPACATAPCNQRRDHQRVGIFPRSWEENGVNRRAQYGCTERGRECSFFFFFYNLLSSMTILKRFNVACRILRSGPCHVTNIFPKASFHIPILEITVSTCQF